MMHDIYSIITGPLLWFSFIAFFTGSIYRLGSMAILAKKKDEVVYAYMDFKYALRSIIHWIFPFGSLNMRKHPVMTIVAFLFHICLFIVPVFLFAHIILLKESWDLSWWFMPDKVADIMTIIVILSCIFFAVRRLMLPEVKYLTSFSDYCLLFIVAAPFITGFWAYHQLPGYSLVGIIHIISGEIMLISIPFTRLSHMLFFFFTRGYIGSEFGAIRHARDW